MAKEPKDDKTTGMPPTPPKLTPTGAPVDDRFPGAPISGTPMEATGRKSEETGAAQRPKSEAHKEKEKEENDKSSTRHR